MQIGQVTLHVEEAGTGPVIVFVHGYTTTGSFWRHQAEAFAAAGYHTVTFDLRGHGRSAKPVDVAYTIEAFTEDLFAVMRELHIDKAVLAGLSMGGAVVLRAALTRPEVVRGLVLADTTARGVGEAVDPERVVSRIAQIGVQEASAEVIDASFAPSADSGLVKWAKREVAAAPRYVAEQAIRSLGAFDVEAQLGAISCPTLVIVGQADHITPRELAVTLRDNIPGAQLFEVPGAAHFPMLEQPEAVTEAIRQFLPLAG